MANEETVRRLPFDIALSRTISYKYNGEHLDWDEVERVIPLEQVLSPSALKNNDVSQSDDHRSSSDLDDYQMKIAQMWMDQKDVSLTQLIDENSHSPFGVRCVGYYALSSNLDDESISKVAWFTLNHEQYDLAARLYELSDKDNELTISDMVRYSQAVSNAYPDLQGASRGLKINERARSLARKRMDEDPNDLQALKDYSYTTQQVAEMLEWTWNISREEDDLEKAIREYREAIRLIEELHTKNVVPPLGRYAQDLICFAMFLRIAENDPDRSDVEKNFQKVLALKAGPGENYVSASNLRWYQIFILAVMGKYEDVQKRTTSAISEDIKYASKRGSSQVGRRQYTKLRRFLEQYGHYWRDTTSIARVSQILNSARLEW